MIRHVFSKFFMLSPFEGLKDHAEKVNECSHSFQQAIECYISSKCKTFEDFREDVARLESEADDIKRRVRGHLPRGIFLPVDKFQVFRYVNEQDKVLNAVKHSLDWISYKKEPGIPAGLEEDFFLLVDSVVVPIEELSVMMGHAREYFRTFSEDQRILVKKIIHKIREYENEADKFETLVKKKIFSMEDQDTVSIFHTIRLSEKIGSIADHAENTADVMRAMIAR